MKLSKQSTGRGMTRMRLLIVVFIILVGAFSALAIDKATVLKQKAEKVVNGIEAWSSNGRDANEPMKLLQQAKAKFDTRRFDEGEALLDQALKILGPAAETKSGQQSLLPQVETKEQTTDLYVDPQRVQIDGYADDCMEPLISPDGRYLFWNNSNAAGVQTHIHFARRTGERQFHYLGLLPGAAASGRDMAPTIDLKGNLYFTADRTYSTDYKSLYCGKFANERLASVHPVPGNLGPNNPGWINMDCCISPGGGTLVLSLAHFDLRRHGEPVPTKSDLLLAQGSASSGFNLDRNSDNILRSVNTASLEYAPAITNDGLELYFTRANELMVAGKSQGAHLRIMVAKRKSVAEPFGEPTVLSAISGFVEGPTLTLDRKELFYHKKDSDMFHIYRVVRH